MLPKRSWEGSWRVWGGLKKGLRCKLVKLQRCVKVDAEGILKGWRATQNSPMMSHGISRQWWWWCRGGWCFHMSKFNQGGSGSCRGLFLSAQGISPPILPIITIWIVILWYSYSEDCHILTFHKLKKGKYLVGVMNYISMGEHPEANRVSFLSQMVGGGDSAIGTNSAA